MLHHPCILGDPQTKGDKISAPAFSGAQKRAEMLFHPCILGGPQTKGGKIRIGYKNVGVMWHFGPLLGTREGKGEAADSDFDPLCLGIPKNVGVT